MPVPSPANRRALGLALAAVPLLLTGCDPDAGTHPAAAHTGTRSDPIAAYCTALVDGVGEVDIETVYLPAVVACENGAASDEGLKAQAVAARSYLYYKLETSGRIGDGTGDQVFSCNRPPGERHLRAVEATRGEVLTNSAGDVIAAFYVAGAIPSTPTCNPAPGDNDPTNTERWVTYNEGRSGAAVTPTNLGHPANPRNRGCKSQNGASCLGRIGVGHHDILRFYYGEDIGIEQAVGACVAPFEPDAGVPPPDAAPPRDATPARDAGVTSDARVTPGTCAVSVGIEPAEVSIDDGDSCFTRACERGDWWVSHAEGENGGSVSVDAIERDRPDCTGRWSFSVAAAGTYAIEVNLPDVGLPLSRQARYVVNDAQGQTEVRLDQSARFGWVSLGRFEFRRGGEAWVVLADNTGEAFSDDGPKLVYDALRVRLVDLDPSEIPPDGGGGAGGFGGAGGAGGFGGVGGAGGLGAEMGVPLAPGAEGSQETPAGADGVSQTGGCAASPNHGPRAPHTGWWALATLATLGARRRRRK